jgi:hypothetical protein
MEDLDEGMNDFKGLVEPGQSVFTLCEGCGYGHFDHNGARIEVHVISDAEQVEIDKMLDAQLEAVQLEEMPEDLFD